MTGTICEGEFLRSIFELGCLLSVVNQLSDVLHVSNWVDGQIISVSSGHGYHL